MLDIRDQLCQGWEGNLHLTGPRVSLSHLWKGDKDLTGYSTVQRSFLGTHLSMG